MEKVLLWILCSWFLYPCWIDQYEIKKDNKNTFSIKDKIISFVSCISNPKPREGWKHGIYIENNGGLNSE